MLTLACLFLTAVRSWQPSQGGELQLFPWPNPPVSIEPLHNRLVLFPSQRMIHRVTPYSSQGENGQRYEGCRSHDLGVCPHLYPIHLCCTRALIHNTTHIHKHVAHRHRHRHRSRSLLFYDLDVSKPTSCAESEGKERTPATAVPVIDAAQH